MPRVTFIHPDGQRESHAAPVGQSVMDCALDNRVANLLGRCGGAPTCATCHCYVDEFWYLRLPKKIGDEADLLEFVFEPRWNSRLACQIRLSDALDGITITLPARQV